MTNPPITTGLPCASDYMDSKEEFGPKGIGLSVHKHGSLTLGLVHDTLMAGLPPQVLENLGGNTVLFMGSVTWRWSSST